MNNFDLLKETVEKIKKGKNMKQEKKIVNQEINKEIADFFKKNAKVGMENLAGESLPALKAVESNSKMELANGNRPSIGYFFYTKNKKEYENLEVSIMSVSRGYYAKGMNKGDKPKFQQIVSGIILDTMEPFIIYTSGKRLPPLWDFAKIIAPYTHRENPIPMMGFKIKLTTTKYKHEYGYSHYINFDIVKDENNNIKIITDIGMLEIIEHGNETMRISIENLIEKIEVDRETGMPIKVGLNDKDVDEAFVDPNDGGQDVPF